MGDQKIPRLDMDQIHLPDPISNDIRELQADNLRLHTRLQEMERRMKCMKEENIEVLDKEEESRYEACITRCPSRRKNSCLWRKER